MKPDNESGGRSTAASQIESTGKPTVAENAAPTGSAVDPNSILLLVTAFTELCRTVRALYGRDGVKYEASSDARSQGRPATQVDEISDAGDELTALLARMATSLGRGADIGSAAHQMQPPMQRQSVSQFQSAHGPITADNNGGTRVVNGGDGDEGESQSIFSWSARPPAMSIGRSMLDAGSGQNASNGQDNAIIARALREEDRQATEAARERERARERAMAQANGQPTSGTSTPDHNNDVTFGLGVVLSHDSDRTMSPRNSSTIADISQQLASVTLSPVLPPNDGPSSLVQSSWPMRNTLSELAAIDPSRSANAALASTSFDWLDDARPPSPPALVVKLPTNGADLYQHGRDTSAPHAVIAVNTIPESRIAVGSERGSIATSPLLSSNCLSSPFNYKPPTASLTQAMLLQDRLANAAILAKEQQRHTDVLVTTVSATASVAIAHGHQGRTQTAVTLATAASPVNYAADKHSPYCGTEDCTFCIHDEHSLPSALADFSPPTLAPVTQSLPAFTLQDELQLGPEDTLVTSSPTHSPYSVHATAQSPIGTQSSSALNVWASQPREVFSLPPSDTPVGQPSAPHSNDDQPVLSPVGSERNGDEACVSLKATPIMTATAPKSDEPHSTNPNLSSPSSVSTANTSANRSFIVKLPATAQTVDILQNYNIIYRTLGLPDAVDVLPMTPRILTAIKATLSTDNADDVRFWAVCMLGFYGMFQENELPDPIFEQSCEMPLSVAIKRNCAALSKPVANTPDVPAISLLLYALDSQSDLCPHAAVCSWIKLESGAPPKMFRERKLTGACSERGRQWLTQRLEQALKAASIDGHYTLASLHLGGAVCAVQARASTEHIRVAAGWDAPKAEFAKTGLHEMSKALATFVSKHSSA